MVQITTPGNVIKWPKYEEKQKEETIMRDRHYKGLEEAINEMPDTDLGNGFYVDLHYDLDKDEVYAESHVSLGYNNRTEYDNPRIVRIGFFAHKVPKEEIIKYIDGEIAFDVATKDKERNGMAAEQR